MHGCASQPERLEQIQPNGNALGEGVQPIGDVIFVPKSVWFELFVVPKSVLKNVIVVPKSVFVLDYQKVMFLLFVSMSMIVFLEIMCFVGVNIDGVCLEKFTLLYIFAKKCCNTFVIAYCLTKI